RADLERRWIGPAWDKFHSDPRRQTQRRGTQWALRISERTVSAYSGSQRPRRGDDVGAGTRGWRTRDWFHRWTFSRQLGQRRFSKDCPQRLGVAGEGRYPAQRNRIQSDRRRY